jgi:mRNA interferase HigB
MRIVAKPKIEEFIRRFPDSEASLTSWYNTMKPAKFNNFSELHNIFKSADMVNGLIVFDISLNKYRLIAHVPFKIKTVFIRHILTHKDYDKENWKE